MENQQSSTEHSSPAKEESGNAFGGHPLASGGFADGGDAPSLPPPALNLGGGTAGPVQLSRDPGANLQPPVQQRSQAPSIPRTPSGPPVQRQVQSHEVSYSENGEIQDNSPGGGWSPPQQQDEGYFPESGDNEFPETYDAPNADLEFFGVSVPRIAPSHTLSPFPVAKRIAMNSGVNTLKTNQGTTTKDADGKLEEAREAVKDPVHEGRKQVAKGKVDHGKNNPATEIDPGGINENVKSKISDIERSIDGFNGNESDIRDYFANAATTKLGEMKGQATTNIEQGRGELKDDVDVKEESTYQHLNQQGGSLPSEIEAAQTTEAIQAGEGAFPEAVDGNADMGGLLEAVETHYNAEMAEEGHFGGEGEGAEIPGLEENPDYQELKRKIQEANLGTITAAVEPKKGELVTTLDQVETDHKAEMDVIREDKLTVAKEKQAEVKSQIELEKARVADAVNIRFDQVKTFVDDKMAEVDGIVNGTIATNYPSSLSNCNVNGYSNAMDWAISMFYTDANLDQPASTGTVQPKMANDAPIQAKFGAGTVVQRGFWSDFLNIVGGAGSQDPGGTQSGNSLEQFLIPTARSNFGERMDAIVTHYTGIIDRGIKDCNEAIRVAQGEIQTIIDNSTLGEEDKSEIEVPLDELRAEVNDEGTLMKDEMIAEKEAKVAEIDEVVASLMVNPLKDLAMAVLSALGEGALWLLELFFKAIGVDFGPVKEFLESVASAIINDPLGFVRTLVLVLKESFVEYFENIGQNLQTIISNWLLGDDQDFDNTGMEQVTFPDGSAESWINFLMGPAGLEGLQSQLIPEGAEIPGGHSVNISNILEGLKTGGFSGMWTSLQAELQNIPIAGEWVGGGQEADGEVKTDAEVLEEFQSSDMTWENLLTQITEMGVGGDFSPADLEEAGAIFKELTEPNIDAFLQRFSGEMGLDFNDPMQFVIDGLKDWIQNDLVQIVPSVLIQFAGGGIGKIFKAIYDTIMWVIENQNLLAGIFNGVKNAIQFIATNDVAGAKGAVTTAINNIATAIISFVADVGLGVKIGVKVSGMVGKIMEKFQKIIDKVVDKIQAALEKFMNAVKKTMGKSKSKRKKKPGEEGEETTYDFPAGVTKDNIKSKINELKGDVRTESNEDTHLPGKSDVPDYKMDTTDPIKNDIKTYKVLKALKEAYTEADAYTKHAEGDHSMTKEEADGIALRIQNRHNVLKYFKAVMPDKAQGTKGTTPDGEEYLYWEWKASPTRWRAAARHERQEDEFRRVEYESGVHLGIQLFFDAQRKIESIQVAGRPEPTFGNSMGDHTTAFIVHVEGVRNGLIGKPLSGAFAEMRRLQTAITQLPGYALKPDLPEAHRNKLQEQEDIMSRVANSDSSSTDENVLTTKLQTMIRAYLEARELVPLSTMNIRGKSATGGSGHGESSAIAVLRDYGKANGPSDNDVVLAIEKLFDLKSTSLVLVETNSARRDSMAPGSGGTKPDGSAYTPQELLVMAWHQHLDSIANSYPNLISFTGAPGATNHDFRNKYGDMSNLSPLISAAENDIAWHGNRCKSRIETLDTTFSSTMVNLSKGVLNKLRIAAAQWEAEKESFLPSFRYNPKALVTFVKNRPYFFGVTGKDGFATMQKEMLYVEESLEEVELSIRILEGLGDASSSPNYANLLNLKSYLENKYEVFLAKYRDKFEFEGQDAPMDIGEDSVDWNNVNDLEKARKDELGDPIEYTGGSEKTDLETFRNTFGIQLVLGDTGKIERVITDGRTGSPFANTMGAHTIAWTLHISHVKSLILKKTVRNAFTSIATEFKDFVFDLETTLTAKTAGSATLRNKRNELRGEINRLVRGNANVGTLQELIANLLAFTNYIPGITKNKDNTDGHGEAEAKRKLEEFEENMWNRVPETTSTLKESDMVDRIKSRYPNDNNLKDKAVYLANAVKVLRDTTGRNYIEIQYQMVENTYPWSYFTIQMGRFKFSGENDLKSVPADPHASELFSNKRPAEDDGGNPSKRTS